MRFSFILIISSLSSKEVEGGGKMIKVDGAKFIDTAGGFLIDEKDIEEHEEERAAKLQKLNEEQCEEVPLTYLKCVECEDQFADSYLQKHFDYICCDKCKNLDEAHELITKTNARDEFLLKDCDFDQREPPLKYISRKNPHKSTWAEMKLYLRFQVQARAIEIYGSLHEIQKQKELREEKREVGKIKKFNKQMVELKKNVRATLFDKRKESHVHEFGPRSYNEETDEYTETCDCGFTNTFEEL